MRYLRKYNENLVFDVEHAMVKIKEHFSKEKVQEMFNDELLQWVDDDWKKEHKSELDWYTKNNNGEAQDIVISQIVDWYTKNFDNINEEELVNKIKETYSCLKTS